MGSHEDYQAHLEYEHRLAMVAAQMLGAAAYLDERPDYATDAVLAGAWRRYVAELREVTDSVPAASAGAAS